MAKRVKADYYDDRPPYSMIGTQTTLPGRCRKVVNRPIGFIWPKPEPKQPKRSGK